MFGCSRRWISRRNGSTTFQSARHRISSRSTFSGALLDLAEHLERGDFVAVESLLEELAVDSPRLLQAQLDAHLWIDALESTQA